MERTRNRNLDRTLAASTESRFACFQHAADPRSCRHCVTVQRRQSTVHRPLSQDPNDCCSRRSVYSRAHARCQVHVCVRVRVHIHVRVHVRVHASVSVHVRAEVPDRSCGCVVSCRVVSCRVVSCRVVSWCGRCGVVWCGVAWRCVVLCVVFCVASKNQKPTKLRPNPKVYPSILPSSQQQGVSSTHSE